MTIKNKKPYSQDKYRLRKFKSILDFVEKLSLKERQKLIVEISIDRYFDELSKCEVIKNSE